MIFQNGWMWHIIAYFCLYYASLTAFLLTTIPLPTCSSLMRSLILAVASSWARNRLMTLARSGSKIFPSSSRTTWSSSRILPSGEAKMRRGESRHQTRQQLLAGILTCCRSRSWRWLSASAPWTRHWAACQTGAGNATPLAHTSVSGPA